MRNVCYLIGFVSFFVNSSAAGGEALDFSKEEYMAYVHPYFEKIHFDGDKIFLTQYRPVQEGPRFQLSALNGAFSDYFSNGDTLYLGNPINRARTETLVTFNNDLQVLSYGGMDYYSTVSLGSGNIIYSAFSATMNFADNLGSGTQFDIFSAEELEEWNGSGELKRYHIDEIDAEVALKMEVYNLSNKELKIESTYFSDDLGIGYITSTISHPMEDFPSVFYSTEGYDSEFLTILMITSAGSTLAYEEIVQIPADGFEPVGHLKWIVEPTSISFLGPKEALLTEANWDREIDRLRLQAKSHYHVSVLTPALVLLEYLRASPLIKSSSSSTKVADPVVIIPELAPDLLTRVNEIYDYIDPKASEFFRNEIFAVDPDFVKGEELIGELYNEFYEGATNDEKRLILALYANTNLAQEKFLETIQIFEQILAHDQLPEVDRLFLVRSLRQLYMKVEKWQKATDIIELQPEDPIIATEPVFRELALAHFNLGHSDKAVAYWQAANYIENSNNDELRMLQKDLLYLITFTQRDLLVSTLSYLLNTEEAIQDIKEYEDLLGLGQSEVELLLQLLKNPEMISRISQMKAVMQNIGTFAVGNIGQYTPSFNVSPIPVEEHVRYTWSSGGGAVAPDYPSRAAQRGIQGYAVVLIGVDINGNVREETIQVIFADSAKGYFPDTINEEIKTTDIFDKAAIRAAKDFKFAPPPSFYLFRGKEVVLFEMEYLFRFQLEPG